MAVIRPHSKQVYSISNPERCHCGPADADGLLMTHFDVRGGTALRPKSEDKPTCRERRSTDVHDPGCVKTRRLI